MKVDEINNALTVVKTLIVNTNDNSWQFSVWDKICYSPLIQDLPTTLTNDNIKPFAEIITQLYVCCGNDIMTLGMFCSKRCLQKCEKTKIYYSRHVYKNVKEPRERSPERHYENTEYIGRKQNIIFSVS